jgi:hypothetical protein
MLATLLTTIPPHFWVLNEDQKHLVITTNQSLVVILHISIIDSHIPISISLTSETGATRVDVPRLSASMPPQIYIRDPSGYLFLKLLIYRLSPYTLRLCTLYASYSSSVWAISTGITYYPRHRSSCLKTILCCWIYLEQNTGTISQHVEDYDFRKGIWRKRRKGEKGTCYPKTEFKVCLVNTVLSLRFMIFDIGKYSVQPCNPHPRTSLLFYTAVSRSRISL